MKKVLLFESEIRLRSRYVQALQDRGIEVLISDSIDDLNPDFLKANNVGVVVLGSRISGQSTTTAIDQIRIATRGQVHFVANSRSSLANDALVGVGCKTRSTGGKFRSRALPDVLRSYLDS